MEKIFLIYLTNKDDWEYELGCIIVEAKNEQAAREKAEKLISDGTLQEQQCVFQKHIDSVEALDLSNGWMLASRGFTE